MASTQTYLAYDLGASSGRAIAGAFDGEKIALSEIHRFQNEPVEMRGTLYWDIPRLFYDIQKGLGLCAQKGVAPASLGIDTWGVDMGLLDRQGNLLGIPVHYRDLRTNGMMEYAFKIMPKAQIFERTGLAFMQFNTLYQLLAMQRAQDAALQMADTMLMTPDLLAYFLTGVKRTEYTIASTSQLTNPHTRTWDEKILSGFSLPRHIFTEIEEPCTVRGMVEDAILSQVSLKGPLPVINVGSHDTASAVAAVPARSGRFAYISSGTWSLLGAELSQPVTAPGVMQNNYTNEGGVQGTTRMLKNIMGLWMIQECKRQWDKGGQVYRFDELVALAEGAPAFLAVIDVDDPMFLAPGDMPARIQAYCREKGQPVPQTIGEISRTIYESLALKYRWSIQRLEEDVLGYAIDALHIVGGGSQNAMLNQFTANAIGRPVLTGPTEATAIGNLLLQAMALGEIGSLSQLREVVAASFPVHAFEPRDKAEWDGAYERLIGLL